MEHSPRRVGGSRHFRKKKELRAVSDPSPSSTRIAPVFLPPELAGQEEFEGMGGKVPSQDDWEKLRQLYLSRLGASHSDPKLDRELARQVLEQAKKVVAHVQRPVVRHLERLSQLSDGDLSIEDSLEENAEVFSMGDISPEDVWVESQRDRKFGCTLVLDCSSSMSGRKHLLACIAVAVLLLQVPKDQAGLVVFASEAMALKRPTDSQGAIDTILKFLRAKPKGFTNIAAGLELGLRVASTRPRSSVLLATDGRATEGKNAAEIASRFHSLSVLHLEGPGSDPESSRDLALAGRGKLIEVENFEELPRKLHSGLRWLSRRA